LFADLQLQTRRTGPKPDMERSGGGLMETPSPGRWPEVERLLDIALDLPPEDRPVFLDRSCSGDQELRTEVERLLQAAEGTGSFLSEPAPAYASPVVGRVVEFEVTTKPQAAS
jgi:hypothetical protein